MCGLVACITKREFGFTSKDKDIFDQLLYADALRGRDSTGIFCVNKFGNVNTLKSAQQAADFQKTTEYKAALNAAFMNGRVLVGHNRAATHGETVDKNAHPFISNNICLVHNGTLYNHKIIADVAVDSHALAIGFSKEGHVKTLDKAFGAYALIWYDAKEQTVYIAKNDQRPLWMIDTPDAIYIASEADMLTWVVGRNLTTKDATIPNPTYFASDKIYSWKINTKQTKFEYTKYEKKAQVVCTITTNSHGTQPITINGDSKTTNRIGQLLHDKYHVGDNINFNCDVVTVFDTRCKIEGVVSDNDKISVRGYINTDLISNSLKTDIMNSDFLNGTITGMVTRNHNVTLLVDNITPDWVVYSCDGTAITFDMVDADLDTIYCHECGDGVDIIDDSGFFWARVRNGKVKSVKCKHCAEKNDHIVKEFILE